MTEDNGITKVFTKNVQAFSVQMEEIYIQTTSFNVEGQQIVARAESAQDHQYLVFTENQGVWKVSPPYDRATI